MTTGSPRNQRGMSDEEEGRLRKAGSRLLVFALLGWIVIFGAGALWVSVRPQSGAELRESPFKPWDGTWEGEFEGFDPAGERVTHLRVRQRYRHVPSDDQFRQEGHFTVTDVATGEVKEEKTLKTASFELTELQRKVYKEKGSVMEVFDGVDEGGSITWKRDIPGAKETFREWIEGDTLSIEGEGVYGDPATVEPLTIRASYRRVGEPAR